MNIGESSYGRTKTLLDVGIRECDVCKHRLPCIGFDASDAEYDTIWICKQCCGWAFSRDKNPPVYEPSDE